MQAEAQVHLLIKDGVEVLEERAGCPCGAVSHPQLQGTPWGVIGSTCTR